MASLLKSIKKGVESGVKSVGDGITIHTLDIIVDDILEKQAKEFDRVVASYDSIVSEQEQTSIEDTWYVRYNESYDRRASEAIGKSIPENWQEDKDLLAVRKRILNRGLAKFKGQLNIKIVERFHAAIDLYKSIIAEANNSLMTFVETTPAIFPIPKDELRALFATHKSSISSKTLEAAPNLEELSARFSGGDVLSWSQFEAKLTDAHNSLMRQNDQFLREAEIALYKRIIVAANTSLESFVHQVPARFPMDKTAVEALTIENRALLNSAAATAAGSITIEDLSLRISGPEILSWEQFQAKASDVYKSLVAQNDLLIREAEIALYQSVLDEARKALASFVERTRAVFPLHRDTLNTLCDDNRARITATANATAINVEDLSTRVSGNLILSWAQFQAELTSVYTNLAESNAQAVRVAVSDAKRAAKAKLGAALADVFRQHEVAFAEDLARLSYLSTAEVAEHRTAYEADFRNIRNNVMLDF